MSTGPGSALFICIAFTNHLIPNVFYLPCNRARSPQPLMVFVVRRFHNFAPYLRPLRGFEPYGTLLQSSQRTGFGCQILREAGDVTPTELDTLPAFTLQLRDSQLPPDYQGWGTLLSAECSQLHTAGLLYSERRLLD